MTGRRIWFSCLQNYRKLNSIFQYETELGLIQRLTTYVTPDLISFNNTRYDFECISVGGAMKGKLRKPWKKNGVYELKFGDSIHVIFIVHTFWFRIVTPILKS